MEENDVVIETPSGHYIYPEDLPRYVVEVDDYKLRNYTELVRKEELEAVDFLTDIRKDDDLNG